MKKFFSNTGVESPVMWHHESGAEKEGYDALADRRSDDCLPAHREALEALVRAHSTSQQLALRARAILHAADNIGVCESARELAVWPKTVRYWRGRWRQAPPAQSLPERPADAPRSGAPATGLATEDLNRQWYERDTGNAIKDLQSRVKHRRGVPL
jgi:hypothetical protein